LQSINFKSERTEIILKLISQCPRKGKSNFVESIRKNQFSSCLEFRQLTFLNSAFVV